jgi:hypothetical protein
MMENKPRANSDGFLRQHWLQILLAVISLVFLLGVILSLFNLMGDLRDFQLLQSG